MNLIKHALPLAFFTVFLSCEKPDNSPEPEGYSQGVYIVNEGSFGQATDPSVILIPPAALSLTEFLKQPITGLSGM